MSISNKIKSIIIIILVITLIALIAYFTDRISWYKSEITNNKSEIDSLKKEVSAINYNYSFTLAKTNCWTCHRFNYATDNLLEGVVERVGEKYLSIFLTKQDSLINAKDRYATSLKVKFGITGNSHNFKFSPSELKAIIDFMK